MQLKQTQLGVSLIESLVALLVISVGLLGIAALQITAMSQNASALNHSQAVWIAYNISDRIRANANAFDDYEDIDTNNSYNQDCSNVCSKEAMVDADAADWKGMMVSLPAGRGRITRVGNELVVAVLWDDDGTGVNLPLDCANPNEGDLACYTVTLAQPVIPD